MAFQRHHHQLGPGLLQHFPVAPIEPRQTIAQDGLGLIELLPGGVRDRDTAHAAGAREPLQVIAEMAARRLGQNTRRNGLFRSSPDPVGVGRNSGQRRQSAESSSSGDLLAFHGASIYQAAQPGEWADRKDLRPSPDNT